MDPLEAAFVAEFSPGYHSRFGSCLKQQIALATTRGRSAFPTLSVDDRAFARHLARALKRMPEAAGIGDLVAEDLYLACACRVGADGAAELLLKRHGGMIRRTVIRIAGQSNGEEIVQALFSNLLVGTIELGPEIGDYGGRAPLAAWLKVVAQRAALLWLRSERNREQVAGRAANEPRLDGQTPPDAALFRRQHEHAFERAIRDALQATPGKNRALLRLYFVDDVSLTKIAKMLGVNQCTVSRWLKNARQEVLSDVKDTLRRRLGISSNAIESLASLVSSRLDLSIAEALK